MNKFKFPLFVILIIGIQIFAFAEKNVVVTADPFPGERPGQYVYYHDMIIS